jgi:hypothetical protein
MDRCKIGTLDLDWDGCYDCVHCIDGECSVDEEEWIEKLKINFSHETIMCRCYKSE